LKEEYYLWELTLYSLVEIYWHFEGASFCHLQGIIWATVNPVTFQNTVELTSWWTQISFKNERNILYEGDINEEIMRESNSL
jgi:hypothetical protein